MTRPVDLPEQILHFIGGKPVHSASGATFDNLDPLTNRAYCTVAAGDAADVAAAVAAARGAFTDGPWPGLLPRARAKILHAVADAVESRDERIAQLDGVWHDTVLIERRSPAELVAPAS